MGTELPRFIAPDDCTSVYPIGSPPVLPEDDEEEDFTEDPAPLDLGAPKPIIHPEITESTHSAPPQQQPVNPKVALAAAIGIAAFLAFSILLLIGAFLALT